MSLSLVTCRQRLAELLREKKYLEEQITGLAAIETELFKVISALQKKWEEDFDGWLRQASPDDLDEFSWMLNNLAGRYLTRAETEIQLDAFWDQVWRDGLIANEPPDVPHRELA
jgi:hypothetical protein